MNARDWLLADESQPITSRAFVSSDSHSIKQRVE